MIEVTMWVLGITVFLIFLGMSLVRIIGDKYTREMEKFEETEQSEFIFINVNNKTFISDLIIGCDETIITLICWIYYDDITCSLDDFIKVLIEAEYRGLNYEKYL